MKEERGREVPRKEGGIIEKIWEGWEGGGGGGAREYLTLCQTLRTADLKNTFAIC